MPKHKTSRTFRRRLHDSVTESLSRVDSSVSQNYLNDVGAPSGSTAESDWSEESDSEELSSTVEGSCDGTASADRFSGDSRSSSPSPVRDLNDSRMTTGSSQGTSTLRVDEGTVEHFRQGLREWSVKNNIRHQALSELLTLARSHDCFASLPTSAKVLLQTPRKCAGISELEGGEYCHFGLAAGLQGSLEEVTSFPPSLTLQVNIDGLPLAKSARDQFWPILCRVSNCGSGRPFAIGIFYGKSKPQNPNNFLQAFVNDLNDLLEHGVLLKGSLVDVRLGALICDAPAKAYILSIVHHNGYYSCTKCNTEGEAKNQRQCFPERFGELKTNESFHARKQDEHHGASHAQGNKMSITHHKMSITR